MLFAKILPVLPYVLGGVLILIIFFLLFLFFVLWGSRKKVPPPKKDETPPEGEEPLLEMDQDIEGKEKTREGRLLFPVLNLRRSFSKAISLLRAQVPGRTYRYKIPWFIMVGEKGSGKTTALGSSGINLSMGKALVERIRGMQACNWWFFDRGVVLDIAGDLVLRGDGRSSDDRAWRALLRLLQKYRPERPLDGVILTIPCTDLIGPRDQVAQRLDRAARKADLLYGKLRKTQRKLGIRFPLYILVTKCDEINGFQSFCRAIPKRLRQHIFGWSNPYAVDTSYSSDWLNEAFRTLNNELYQTQMGVHTEGVDPQESDGIFLFPTNFQSIAESLKTYLEHIFRESVYHEAFLFRGLYFCGDSGMEPAETAQKRPFFLKDLFERKIFPEFGLARPAAKQLISRNRSVLATQGIALFLALVWGMGLWFAYRNIQGIKNTLIPVLQNIENDLRVIKLRERVDPAFFHQETQHLIKGMSRASVSDLGSLFIPSSWFADIDDRIEDAITLAYENIMMKSLFIEMDNRAKKVVTLGRGPSKTSQKEPKPFLMEETPELIALRDYVGEVKELEKHAGLYNHLATMGEDDLNDLALVVKYLFGVELPQDFYLFVKHYQKALSRATGDHMNLMTFKPPATEKAEKLIQNLYNRLFQANVISAYLQIMAIQLESFGRKSRSAAQDGKMISNLLDTIKQAEGVLADPDMAWVAKEHLELGASFYRILTAIEESKLLGPELRSRFEKAGERAFQELRSELRRKRTSLTGPLLHLEDDEIYLAFSQGLLDLKNDLQSLLAQEFMILEPTERETIRIPPGTRVLWDIKFLEEAVKAVEPYESFVRHGLKSFPSDLRHTIKNTAQQTFGLNMLQLIAKAQNLRPVSTRFVLHPMEADVRLEIENFKEASKFLGRLLLAFERLELVDSYMDLANIVNWQTTTLLEAVEKLFSAEAFYTVKGGDLSWWEGAESLALSAFDVNDQEELKYFLDLQRERIKYLAYEYAEPIISFFMGSSIPRDRAGTRVFTKWERVLSAFDKFESKKPKNPITVLERFILFDMNKINRENYFEKISEKDLSLRSGDFFLEVRNNLLRILYDQCQWLTAKKVMKEYTEIETFFNHKLAGKFPFSSFDDLRGQLEVEPEEIRNFYRLLDHYPKTIEQIKQIEKFFGITGGRSVEFLSQMEAIRRFLAPFLDSGDKEKGKEKSPVYDFAVEFRVNKKHEIAGNQIIEWSLTVGEQEFRYKGEKNTGRWRLGDPIRLFLRWAKDSPDYPIKGPDLPWVKVEDRTVQYEYINQWSLIHLLLRHAGSPADFEGLIDPKPHTLKFEINTRWGGLETQAEERYQTRIFIRLTPLTPDEKEKKALVMPAYFPGKAPQLELKEEKQK
ncbi:MAG: type VI secretion protein IcmF/TssM N-terminal domain-containing protein [Pseudomonadota bacterium]